MCAAVIQCSNLPPRGGKQRSVGANKGPLKIRHLGDKNHNHHYHRAGFCEYCWAMENPATPTLLDETSAGLSDNPFTEDDEDEAFGESSSISSCLGEEEDDGIDSIKNIENEAVKRHEVLRAPKKVTLPREECEVVTHRRFIRRRISRPSPLPSLYRASINSQEANSASGILKFHGFD